MLQSLSVGTLRQGPQTFSDDDPTHPLPPLQLGCSRDRARLALQSIAKVVALSSCVCVCVCVCVLTITSLYC